jgi:hypothetical protein
VDRTGTLPPLKCGALLSFIGGAFATGGGGKAGSKPVAIIATIDRGSLIAAGATEQTRNRGAHGRPNAVVRSARERRKEMLGAGDTSTQQRRDAVHDDVRCFNRRNDVGWSH